MFTEKEKFKVEQLVIQYWVRCDIEEGNEFANT